MNHAHKNTIREAVGVFADPKSLETAAERLAQAGFSDDRFTLLTTDSSVKEHLDHLFESTGDESSPTFSPRKEGDDATHGIGRGLAFTGQTVAAGAVVATAAALGGPVIIGLAGAAAVGAAGAAMIAIISQEDADDLQEHLDQGHLLLCARIEDEADEQAAKAALADNSLDVRILEFSAADE
ncbi:MAG: hypothetical protein EA417_11730 [Gammaproteobacteria bacterium]|nr:MAG: hypothetical protein EA417_11730 [Gammaproteobacteria bacterium]